MGPNITCKVAAINLTPLDNYVYPPEVSWQISQDNKNEYADLAKKLNEDNLVSGIILQHEYGICGGEEGENILSFVENCHKPILATLHTVLPDPSPKMKDITGRIIKQANIIVVLTNNSRKILEEIYPFSIGKVYVIPHGIHQTEFTQSITSKKKFKISNSTVLSTFGLLSRGKGIEYVIHALPEVIKKYPNILYLVIGGTHPSVRREEGESYRLELTKLVTELGLTDNVRFYDQFLELDDLLEFLKATDIYISTSINPNQAVSGTLSYALGTGRAVISTQFPQAKEIITSQIGRLVPIKDPASITAALLDLLSDSDRLLQMNQNAYDLTRSMLWSNVSKQYSELLTQAVLPPLNLNHLKRMTDNFGLFQFSILTNPDKSSGYTLDDNARALVVCSQILSQQPETKNIDHLIDIYLNYIQRCQKVDGYFVNYLDTNKEPTDQNNREDLSDANARAIWGLGEIINNHKLPQKTIAKALSIFTKTVPNLKTFTHLRSRAFIIKSLITLVDHLPQYRIEFTSNINELAGFLATALKTNSNGSWQWFESHLGYNNALLSESLLLAGVFLNNPEYISMAESSLQFLIDETFATNMYSPIGHSEWYKKNEKRSYFDQQPEDPSSMILALVTFYQITKEERYKNLAIKCFSWFFGNNSLGKLMYDYQSGGCYDGLHPDRVNLNQGAESLVSYLLSRLAVNRLVNHEN